MSTHAFDDITAESLRAAGWKKWTEFPGTLGAWIAEMDFGTAPAVQEVLRRSADGPGLGYADSGTRRSLREATARFVGDRYGWQIAPDDVRPAADVMTIFQAAVRVLSRPGSPIILPTPAYMPFLTFPAALDREIIQVPLREIDGRYRYDLDALDAAFEAGGDLMVLCNPHNPIGRVLEQQELAAISEVVARHGGHVFADEIHAPLIYDGRRHIPYATVSSAAAAHTITATSASKAFNLPGLKCAQLVLSGDVARERWQRYGAPVEDQLSTLGALAAVAAYEHGQPWLSEVVGYLDGNRRLLADLVTEHLPGVRYTPPEGTYLAWLDFTGTGLEDVARLVRRETEVVATPGPLCGSGGEGYLRLNFATPRPILTEIVTRIGTVLQA